MRARLILAVYGIAFSVATFNHASDLIRYGWFPYRFAPMPMNVFWTSLTLLDPAVVALLLTGWRRTGLALALAIMVADVGVNSYALYGLGEEAFAVAVQLQTLFLGFVAGSIAYLWTRTEKPGAPG